MNQKNTKKGLVLIVVTMMMVLFMVGTVLAAEPPPPPTPVFWAWDFESGNINNPVGSSKLVRTDSGISASYQTDVLKAGNAVTLWFIVFNFPEACLGGPYMCSPLDLGDTAAQGDFFLASGHVIGQAGQGNFGGYLAVGDTSRSGLAETLGGCENCTPGLINPEGALVVLATHDHGPALTGLALQEQISTFLGDCDAGFLGNQFGFATGLQDIPVEPGKCSTIQFSPHMPLGN